MLLIDTDNATLVTGQILGSHKRKSSKRKARLGLTREHSEHPRTGIPRLRDGR